MHDKCMLSLLYDSELMEEGEEEEGEEEEGREEGERFWLLPFSLCSSRVCSYMCYMSERGRGGGGGRIECVGGLSFLVIFVLRAWTRGRISSSSSSSSSSIMLNRCSGAGGACLIFILISSRWRPYFGDGNKNKNNNHNDHHRHNHKEMNEEKRKKKKIKFQAHANYSNGT